MNRKLLEDVRDALKPFAQCDARDGAAWRDSIQVRVDATLGDVRRAHTTLARVEAALAETGEEKLERVARAIAPNDFLIWDWINTLPGITELAKAELFLRYETLIRRARSQADAAIAAIGG